jgi:glutathionyl-hydroquinone reductase
MDLIMETKKNKSLPPSLIVVFGKLIWTTMWQMMMSKLAPGNNKGEYLRPESQFRNFINTEETNLYQPEKDRYRLYVGLSCPWAHRTLIVRTLKGLEDVISIALATPSPTEGGWVIEDEKGRRTLAALYQESQPNYTGRFTVPVLWDQQTKTIVNNESSEIIIMLNSEFNQFAKNPDLDLYPEALRQQIEQWNEKIYHHVNNGVYRCGLAQSQEAYEEAFKGLFTTLAEIDQHLETNRYLCGEQLTLADVRLFTTLIRFDVAYYGLFKCNLKRIKDYQYLGAYLKALYQLPGIAETCDLEAIKRDYYGNLFPLNPGAIIPIGPDCSDLRSPS